VIVVGQFSLLWFVKSWKSRLIEGGTVRMCLQVTSISSFVL
jgi:hypothetical protein